MSPGPDETDDDVTDDDVIDDSSAAPATQALYAAELAGVYDAEIDRLVAFVCSSHRHLGFRDAENLAREAFMITRRRWEQVRGDDNPAAFVFATARSLAADRQGGPVVRGDLLDRAASLQASLQTNVIDLAAALALQTALDELAIHTRQLLLLDHLLSFDASDTGKILGIPPAQVPDAAQAAVDALGAVMARGDDPGDEVLTGFAALRRALRRGERSRARDRQRFLDAVGGTPGRRPEPLPVRSPTRPDAPFPAPSPAPSALPMYAAQTPAVRTPAAPTDDVAPLPELALEALIATTTAGRQTPPDTLSPAHRSILSLCSGTVSVAEIAGRMELPLVVARQTIAEMVARGLLTVISIPAAREPSRDPAFLRRVLAGLRRL